MTALKIVCPCWWFNIGQTILHVVVMSKGFMPCYWEYELLYKTVF